MSVRYARDSFHVLLVEDSPADVRMAQEALKALPVPCQVSVVQDGVDAWRFLTREAGFTGATLPDLVLLDLNLPGKDGRSLLADIKNDLHLRIIPVLVLTTSDSEQDIRESYALQANCYLVKPLGLPAYEDLMKAVGGFWMRHVALAPSTR